MVSSVLMRSNSEKRRKLANARNCLATPTPNCYPQKIYIYMFAFLLIPQHLYDLVCWDSEKARAEWLYIFTLLFADGLVTQGINSHGIELVCMEYLAAYTCTTRSTCLLPGWFIKSGISATWGVLFKRSTLRLKKYKFKKKGLVVQWRPFITRFIIVNILESSILISLHNMLPFELTKDTPYLALSGELWSVFYEYLNRNWSCYKGFLLYMD